MKTVILRMDEAKVAQLMDQFVGRIERTAALLESSDAGDTKRVGVVAIFRRKGEQLQVLLGKRMYAPQAGKYALPGGHVKEGEDLDSGARREIKEETGLELDGLKKLRTRPGDGGETVHIYGTMYTGTERPEADDETAGVKWMNVDDLPKGLAWDNNELIPKLAEEMPVTEGITAGSFIKGQLRRLQSTLGEAGPVDVKTFILNTPTFTFKIDQFHGQQVFINTTHAGPWPQPIGSVNQDPDGRWFIVSGMRAGGAWRWWETNFPLEPNDMGGAHGPRFNNKEQAGLAIWHQFRDAMSNRHNRFTKPKPVAEARMWTQESARAYLAEVLPSLQRIGWTGEIVGSVGRRGWSNKDLDILVHPVGRDARDFVAIDNFVRKLYPQAETRDLGPQIAEQWNCAQETWAVDLPDGRVVEFFIRLEAQ